MHFALCTISYADEDEVDDTSSWDTEQDIDDSYESGDIDYDTYQTLVDLFNSKIDLNLAEYNELLGLPGLTPDDCVNIIDYRIKNGPYSSLTDLLKVPGFDELKIDAIKIFVSAEPVGQIKTSGDLQLKTKSANYVEGDITEYLRTAELLRFRVRKFGDFFKFGVISEAYPKYEDYFVINNILSAGNSEKRFRLNKIYTAYENGPFFKQVYFGNFKAGFGLGLTFNKGGGSKPFGFYPDDTTSASSSITWIYPDRTMKMTLGYDRPNLKGTGIRILKSRIDYSFFYSKSAYPLRAGILLPNGVPAAITLADIFEEEIIGNNIAYRLGKNSYLGGIIYRSNRDINLNRISSVSIWRYPPSKIFWVYGGYFQTNIKGVNVFLESSQVNTWGQGTYLKVFKKFGDFDITTSYRNYDIDYYNPHAKAYSKHASASRFKNRDEIGQYFEVKWKPVKDMNFRFYYDRFSHTAKYNSETAADLGTVSYENPSTDTELYGRMQWKLSKGIYLEMYRKIKDLDIYKNTESSEKMNVASQAQLKFRPSKLTECIVRYKFTEDYYDTPAKYFPKDDYYAQLKYNILPGLELKSSLKYTDTHLFKKGYESRTFNLQMRNKISANMNVYVSYNNKFNKKSDEFELEDFILSADSPGDSNKWEARLEYKW